MIERRGIVAPAHPPLLELDDARLMRGENEILHGLTLRIEPGQKTGLSRPFGLQSLTPSA